MTSLVKTAWTGISSGKVVVYRYISAYTLVSRCPGWAPKYTQGTNMSEQTQLSSASVLCVLVQLSCHVCKFRVWGAMRCPGVPAGELARFPRRPQAPSTSFRLLSWEDVSLVTELFFFFFLMGSQFLKYMDRILCVLKSTNVCHIYGKCVSRGHKFSRIALISTKHAHLCV